MSHRGIFRKGEFLIGASYSADVAARAEVQRSAPVRGDFITGGPVAIAKAAPPLPADLEHFESTAQAAGPIITNLIAIEHRLDALRAAVRKAKRK